MLKGAEEAELRSAWDWTPGKRHVADLRQRAGDFEWREEHQVSPDGENIAAVVKLGETSTVCVSGDFWYLEFEKIWNVRYSPDGRLTALVMTEDEWTVAVDERLWPEAYAYLWDTRFSADGRVIAVAVQQDMRYGMIQDGTIWETLFENANGFTISPEGSSTAAVVQTVPFGQADIDT
ncbi:MAG: WD40 repeat domain-containing protein, partial [Desulfovibrionales bacterium]